MNIVVIARYSQAVPWHTTAASLLLLQLVFGVLGQSFREVSDPVHSTLVMAGVNSEVLKKPPPIAVAPVQERWSANK